jgi:hypothetical protein
LKEKKDFREALSEEVRSYKIDKDSSETISSFLNNHKTGQTTWVAFQESPISHTSLKRSSQAALCCAHRTSTVSSCAFCEQEGHLAASFSGLSVFPLLLGGGLVDPQMRASNEHLLSVRVPRAGGRPGRPLFPPSSLVLSFQGQSCCRCGHQSPVGVLP